MDIEDLKLESKIKGGLLSAIFFIITFIPLALFSGWCLSTLWNWWITPIIGISLSVVQALGVSLVVNFLKVNISELSLEKKEKQMAWWQRDLSAVLIKLILVGMNYIIYIFLAK